MSGRETKVNDEKETYTMKDFYNPLIGMSVSVLPQAAKLNSSTAATQAVSNFFIRSSFSKCSPPKVIRRAVRCVYFLPFRDFMRCSWFKMALRIRRLLGVTSSSSPHGTVVKTPVV